jgi:hypothetical protein
VGPQVRNPGKIRWVPNRSYLAKPGSYHLSWRNCGEDLHIETATFTNNSLPNNPWLNYYSEHKID